jgi:hypothetical protein
MFILMKIMNLGKSAHCPARGKTLAGSIPLGASPHGSSRCTWSDIRRKTRIVTRAFDGGLVSGQREIAVAPLGFEEPVQIAAAVACGP